MIYPIDLVEVHHTLIYLIDLVEVRHTLIYLIDLVEVRHTLIYPIELAVISSTMTLGFQWSVNDDPCGSDHFPIFFILLWQENPAPSSDLCLNSIAHRLL